MKQSDVNTVIGQFAARGRTLAEWDAVNFLGARELLTREPNHKLAAEVVEHYTSFLATGIEACRFAKFMLPEFFTDEEIAERDRALAAQP